MRNKLACTGAILLAFLLSAPTGWAIQQKRPMTEHARMLLEKQIRHELVMLPYYGVFDNLMFKLDDRNVTLLGQVSRPSLKDAAEKAVRKLEGVERVDNRIEVLPLSSNDDRIRRAVYRSVYSAGPLQRYSLEPIPPIHIIVKRGHVALEGVVASEAEKTWAGIRAKQVPLVFSVTNNLRVESRRG